MAGGQIERDNAQALGVYCALELGPVVRGESGEAVDGFDQQYTPLRASFSRRSSSGRSAAAPLAFSS